MKLFLSSEAIAPAQASAFAELVGKPPENTRIAIIENAADVEAGDKSWVEENRRAIQDSGFQVKFIDLNTYKPDKRIELRSALENVDAIWLGGGNTYYLRWILKETGADDIIKELVKRGKVYGGGSAGAIMAGPTLKFFETADDPKEAPVHMTDGLSLTNTVVVPHWQDEKYGPIIASIADKLETAGYSIEPITNEQALIIDGNRKRVVG